MLRRLYRDQPDLPGSALVRAYDQVVRHDLLPGISDGDQEHELAFPSELLASDPDADAWDPPRGFVGCRRHTAAGCPAWDPAWTLASTSSSPGS